VSPALTKVLIILKKNPKLLSLNGLRSSSATSSARRNLINLQPRMIEKLTPPS
jgi:hypothetical protein